MKKHTLIIVCCIFCVLTFSCQPKSNLNTVKNDIEKKPNIIFFFSDDQSYDTQKDFGNPDVKTPNLDRLAEHGLLFQRHYNTTAICMASRANVMTGQFEYKTGCNFDHGSLGTKQWSTSFPLKLKEAGYKVGFGGKFGFSVSDTNEGWKREGEVAKKDFDFWVGGTDQTKYKTAKNKYLAKYADKYPHSTRAYGAATIDFINESVKEDKPFCMSVFYKAPHRPVQPDPMFDDVYKNTVFHKLPNYGRVAGQHLTKHSRLGRQYPRFEEWGYSEDASYQEALRKYHQLIYGVDYSIGMVLEQLEALGIDDNTVIIFSSDNGYFNGSHGLGSKVLPYEEGARVPLIIYDPRHKKSNEKRNTNMITANVDIPATILDLAGVEIPEIYDGKSLLPAINTPDKPVRKSLPIIQVWGPKQTHCLTVLDEQFKYIYWFYKDENEQLVPTEELFDIKNDPYELKNLSHDPKHLAQLEKMRKLYDKQVQHWKSEGVKYNGYEEYETLFDRSISWDNKEVTLSKMMDTKKAHQY
ncbi:sulfatase family protein [Flammeovirga pacifica]|uniref:Acetylglucosamine-6-sulfatase n=1 Tax=Flammeovirga pacifica TaxID=915059 RepID=A0A1S1YRZ7_FLAPC|nr:sulfatase [Flammeovirga pacifica]OHX63804.1 acetylglucosamine-6-sulfatase [Flammeovirga pacifica]